QGNRVNGGAAVRCAYLGQGASLIGFALRNGGTRNQGELLKEQSGGGAWCEYTNCRLLSCLMISNVAFQNGGGTFSGSLSNCTFSNNSARSGGGAFGGVLNSCVLSGNSATNGGAACSNILFSCWLTTNRATGNGGAAYGCT